MIDFGSDGRDILIYAFRYALGRATYSTHTVSSVILDNWDNLSHHDKQLFKREIQEAFDIGAYGMDCDKKSWEKVLERK